MMPTTLTRLLSESNSIFSSGPSRPRGEIYDREGLRNTSMGNVIRLATSLVLLIIGTATVSSAQSFDHTGFDLIVRAVSTPNGVRYAKLKTDRAGVAQYIDQLGTVSDNTFGAWPRADQIAYLINAYNAIVLLQVIDAYPIKRSRSPAALLRPANSVWQIDGFFSTHKHRVAGRDLTLDQIEHEWLRARLQEPRIHFALVCAARSCPPLRSEAYHPDRLDAQLDEQARRFLNDRAHNRFSRDGAELSEIFKWFAEDFGGEPGLRAYLSRYLHPDLSTRVRDPDYRIRYIDYDWALNDVARP